MAAKSGHNVVRGSRPGNCWSHRPKNQHNLNFTALTCTRNGKQHDNGDVKDGQCNRLNAQKCQPGRGGIPRRVSYSQYLPEIEKYGLRVWGNTVKLKAWYGKAKLFFKHHSPTLTSAQVAVETGVFTATGLALASAGNIPLALAVGTWTAFCVLTHGVTVAQATHVASMQYAVPV